MTVIERSVADATKKKKAPVENGDGGTPQQSQHPTTSTVVLSLARAGAVSNEHAEMGSDHLDPWDVNTWPVAGSRVSTASGRQGLISAIDAELMALVAHADGTAERYPLMSLSVTPPGNGILDPADQDIAPKSGGQAPDNAPEIEIGVFTTRAAKETKHEADYRLKASEEQDCGQCVHIQFHGSGPSTCALVVGTVDSAHVCDEFDAAQTPESTNRAHGAFAQGHPFEGNQWHGQKQGKGSYKPRKAGSTTGILTSIAHAHQRPSPEDKAFFDSRSQVTATSLGGGAKYLNGYKAGLDIAKYHSAQRSNSATVRAHARVIQDRDLIQGRTSGLSEESRGAAAALNHYASHLEANSRAFGSHAAGHPFYGNKYTKEGSSAHTPSPEAKPGEGHGVNAETFFTPSTHTANPHMAEIAARWGAAGMRAIAEHRAARGNNPSADHKTGFTSGSGEEKSFNDAYSAAREGAVQDHPGVVHGMAQSHRDSAAATGDSEKAAGHLGTAQGLEDHLHYVGAYNKAASRAKDSGMDAKEATEYGDEHKAWAGRASNPVARINHVAAAQAYDDHKSALSGHPVTPEPEEAKPYVNPHPEGSTKANHYAEAMDHAFSEKMDRPTAMRHATEANNEAREGLSASHTMQHMTYGDAYSTYAKEHADKVSPPAPSGKPWTNPYPDSRSLNHQWYEHAATRAHASGMNKGQVKDHITYLSRLANAEGGVGRPKHQAEVKAWRDYGENHAPEAGRAPEKPAGENAPSPGPQRPAPAPRPPVEPSTRPVIKEHQFENPYPKLGRTGEPNVRHGHYATAMTHAITSDLSKEDAQDLAEQHADREATSMNVGAKLEHEAKAKAYVDFAEKYAVSRPAPEPKPAPPPSRPAGGVTEPTVRPGHPVEPPTRPPTGGGTADRRPGPILPEGEHAPEGTHEGAFLSGYMSARQEANTRRLTAGQAQTEAMNHGIQGEAAEDPISKGMHMGREAGFLAHAGAQHTAEPERPQPPVEPTKPPIEPTSAGPRTPADGSKYLKGSPKYEAFNRGHAEATKDAADKNMEASEATRASSDAMGVSKGASAGDTRAHYEGMSKGYGDHADRLLKDQPPRPEPEPGFKKPEPEPARPQPPIRPPIVPSKGGNTTPGEIHPGFEGAYGTGVESGRQHALGMLADGKTHVQIKALSSNRHYRLAKAARLEGNHEEHAKQLGFAHGLNAVARETKAVLGGKKARRGPGAGDTVTPPRPPTPEPKPEPAPEPSKPSGEIDPMEEIQKNPFHPAIDKELHEAFETGRDLALTHARDNSLDPETTADLMRAQAQTMKDENNPRMKAAHAGTLAGFAQHITENSPKTVGDLKEGHIVGRNTAGDGIVVTGLRNRPGGNIAVSMTSAAGESQTIHKADQPISELAKAHNEHIAATAPPKPTPSPSGSSTSGITPEDRQAGRKQAARLLLSKLPETMMHRDLAEAMQYHAEGHTPGTWAYHHVAQQAGSRYNDVDSWAAHTMKALHDSNSKEEFDQLRPSLESGKYTGSGWGSPSHERILQHAYKGLERGALHESNREDAEAGNKAMDALAHAVSTGEQSPYPTMLSGSYGRDGGDRHFNQPNIERMRRTVEAQMPKDDDQAMPEFRGISVNDFARHNAVMRSGQAVADRIDARPDVQAAKREADEAEREFATTARPSEDPNFGTLSTDERMALAKAHGDATERYKTAQAKARLVYRNASTEELAKERDFGGGATEHKIYGPKGLADDVRHAMKYYPTDWIDNSKAGSQLSVKSSSVGGGHYAQMAMFSSRSQRSRQAAMKFAAKHGLQRDYSEIKAHPGHRTVIVHETGHRMEHTTEGINRLEAAHIEARSSGQAPRNIAGYSGEKVVGKPDQFTSPYAGRLYGSISTGHEVLTEGMQSMFGEDTSSGGRGGLVGLDRHVPDPRLRAFTLGLLASHARKEQVQNLKAEAKQMGGHVVGTGDSMGIQTFPTGAAAK